MKNIIILGGGFGGIRAAKTLAGKLASLKIGGDYEVVLVDRNAYHTYTPLLYEAATASPKAAGDPEVGSSVSHRFEDLITEKNIRVVNAEVAGIDFEKMAIKTGNGDLPFDYLVLAAGSEINYFNIPGMAEHSLNIKTLKGALGVRNTLWEAANRVEGTLRVLVGGGGSTGIELAGEIREAVPEIQRDEKHIPVEVSILEASPSILFGFDKNVVAKVLKRLKKLGVKVMAGNAVKEVKDGQALMANGDTIPFDVLIWTGGVKANALVQGAPLQKEKHGRVEITGALTCLPTDEKLQVANRIYAVGDLACIINKKTGRPEPQVARAAITEGDIAACNIIERIKKENGLVKEARERAYVPVSYPYIIPVGGKHAVAKVGPFIVTGVWGWILKNLVELNYLRSVMPAGHAWKTWIAGLRIFTKNDRLG